MPGTHGDRDRVGLAPVEFGLERDRRIRHEPADLEQPIRLCYRDPASEVGEESAARQRPLVADADLGAIDWLVAPVDNLPVRDPFELQADPRIAHLARLRGQPAKVTARTPSAWTALAAGPGGTSTNRNDPPVVSAVSETRLMGGVRTASRCSRPAGRHVRYRTFDFDGGCISNRSSRPIRGGQILGAVAYRRAATVTTPPSTPASGISNGPWIR